ncbi:MAG: HAD family hydrolase [Acidobacteriaceae bacterium]
MVHYNRPMSVTSTPARLSNQTLFIDADDTLWENNIYFERAIASFIADLDHLQHTPAQIREQLNRCERATIATHGYGLQSFRRSLVDCFEQLSDIPITPERHARITSLIDAIASTKIELLAGVAQTLQILSQRHRLILVTKGNHLEQTDKLRRSGLQVFFNAVEVPPEKTDTTYRTIAQQHRCDPTTTWMIGNSPRSDINPALAAGLHAVFIPHACTWVLEHEAVDSPSSKDQLLELTSFSDLLQYF